MRNPSPLVTSNNKKGGRDSEGRSRKREEAATDSEEEEEKPQEELLLDTLDYEGDAAVFRTHLQLEFIEELLDFYLAVDEWREEWLRSIAKPKQSKMRKARTAAVELYATFIHTDAPRLINIPSQERVIIAEVFAPLWDALDPTPVSPPTAGSFSKPSRALITQKLPKVSKHYPELDQLDLNEKIFNNAQTTTFGMLLEPFSRFLESPEYRKLKKQNVGRAPKEASISRRLVLKSRRPVKFEDIPEDEDIHKAFHNVLLKEFSEESLAFWMALQTFIAARPSELAAKAPVIFKTFITDEKVYIAPEHAYTIKSRIDSGKVDRQLFDLVRWDVEAILRTKFSDHLVAITADVERFRRGRA